MGRNGLVVGVVQDVADGRVLMVGWLDVEALAATLGTGDVHFHSRSRGRLWRKGESSGHVLQLRSLALDCDGDALLIGAEPPARPATARPAPASTPTPCRGPCPGFDPATPTPRARARRPDGAAATAATSRVARASRGSRTLWATIAGAGRAPAPRLVHGGRCSTAASTWPGRKVAEEATEVLLAAKNDETAEAPGRRPASRLARCSPARPADLVYHALVLLAERGLEPRAVVARSGPATGARSAPDGLQR